MDAPGSIDIVDETPDLPQCIIEIPILRQINRFFLVRILITRGNGQLGRTLAPWLS
jgi:hypothetical protein